MEIVYSVGEGFEKFKVLKVLECKPTDKARLEALRTEAWLAKTKAMLIQEHCLP